jgi:hypothetical protein
MTWVDLVGSYLWSTIRSLSKMTYLQSYLEEQKVSQHWKSVNLLDERFLIRVN